MKKAKKLILAVAVSLLFTGLFGPRPAFAEGPTILFSLGKLNLYLPFSTVNANYLYDFKGQRGLVGAETPITGWHDVQFILGGVTSETGKGSPFVGFHLNLTNPAENYVPLAAIRPGLVVGKDFSTRAYIVAIKASASLW